MNRTAHIASILLAGTLSAAAQSSYTKDVDVTVELQPELRAASRLDLSPQVLRKTLPAAPLQSAGKAMALPATPFATVLRPAAGNPVYSASDLDGYLVAGYFPGLDIGASAGYRLVNTQSTRLSAWTQYNRNSHKGYTTYDEQADESKRRLTTNDFDLGLNFSHSARRGTLSSATSLYLSHFNYLSGTFDPSTQNVTRYRLSAGWQSTLNDAASGFSVMADLDCFKYGKASFPEAFAHETLAGARPLHELSGGVAAAGQLMFTDNFGIGLNAGWRGAGLSERYLYMQGTDEFHAAGRLTRGVISVGASFRFKSSKFSGHIGPQIDFGTGDGAGTRTGAAGSLCWNLSRYFLLFTTTETGTQLNTLGALYDRSRYAAPLSAAAPSFLDSDLRLGMSLGPFRGFSITALCGYSHASDWAMPALADGVSTFASGDIATGFYSVSLAYDRGSTFSVKATLQGAFSDDFDNTYYKWDDRASQVLDATMTWHPVDELTISGGYELRNGRKILSFTSINNIPGQPSYPVADLISMGRISRGHVAVAYAFDKTFSLFARVEGIGQTRHMDIGYMPGRGLHGLAGLTLRF